jgi:hypothetical protein
VVFLDLPLDDGLRFAPQAIGIRLLVEALEQAGQSFHGCHVGRQVHAAIAELELRGPIEAEGEREVGAQVRQGLGLSPPLDEAPDVFDDGWSGPRRQLTTDQAAQGAGRRRRQHFGGVQRGPHGKQGRAGIQLSGLGGGETDQRAEHEQRRRADLPGSGNQDPGPSRPL